MNDLSLKKLTVDLSVQELKLLLVALDSFHRNLKDPKTRHIGLLNIHEADSFFNFDFDILSVVNNLTKFLNADIGTTGDKLYQVYFDYADANGLLKPIPDDCPYTLDQLKAFIELDAGGNA